VGNGGWPGLSVYTAPNLSSRKRQSIACPSFTNACFMSMIWSSRERNRSCSLVPRRSRGRIAKIPRSISSSEKNHGLRFEGILKINCKEIALQWSKTGKFDYLIGPNHPAHSTALEFFTDDELWSMSAIVSFTEVTTHPYASSVRLISEPHRGQASFLASAIFRNVK